MSPVGTSRGIPTRARDFTTALNPFCRCKQRSHRTSLTCRMHGVYETVLCLPRAVDASPLFVLSWLD
ncbi:hypothetical protein HYQ46_003607 [Verticillium longisporum]|nr:hypothetical protein HYQ46_003607 [Verticillium longisporum]